MDPLCVGCRATQMAKSQLMTEAPLDTKTVGQLVPFSGCLTDELPEHSLGCSVESLHQTMSLWMVWTGFNLSDLQQRRQLIHELGHKFTVLICQQLGWYASPAKILTNSVATVSASIDFTGTASG